MLLHAPAQRARLSLTQPPERASGEQDQSWLDRCAKAGAAVVDQRFTQCYENDQVSKKQLPPESPQRRHQAERGQQHNWDRKRLAHGSHNLARQQARKALHREIRFTSIGSPEIAQMIEHQLWHGIEM